MLRILCLSVAVGLTAGSPYNPSNIWVSNAQEQPTVYLLSQTSSALNEFRFQSTNLLNPFDVDSPSFNEFPAPPFSNRNVRSIVPVHDPEGVPTVYTGDCQSDAAEIWRFVGSKEESNVGGGWSRWSIQPNKNGDQEAELKGPNYLAAAVGIPSSGQPSAPKIFIFAGMCPKPDTTSDNWVLSANYSRTIVALEKEGASLESGYTHEELSLRSPPVAEAGFSMTPLLPAYANSSTGNQIRQQSFVLIGGHTQTAFINMSQVALLSLPEESWSYLPVKQPILDSTTKPLPNPEMGVEPRSGHTAVLTLDGSKIIVFGGWVGDTSMPAQPQLAILEVGKEYGGNGDWGWIVPKSTPDGPQEGTGIFGHGAAMLPGDIMLVVGGYEIPNISQKRAIPEKVLSQKTYLFNVTSGSWTTSYTKPINDKDANPRKKTGPLATVSQKAGLGVGLGVGIPVAALAIFAFCFLRDRRSREHRKYREQTLRNLALGAERPHIDHPEMTNSPYHPGTVTPGDTSYHHLSAFGAHENDINEKEDASVVAERTGLLLETPSPTRGLRPSMRSKTYQAANLQEDPTRRNIKFSPIHPIDEGDEYEDARTSQPEDTSSDRGSKGSRASDPFIDPPSPSKTSFPSLIPRSQSGGQGEGYTPHDWMYAAGRSNPQYNSSPDKQDRTLSNLSGTSSSTTHSYHTNPRSLKRNPSQISNFGSHLNQATLEREDYNYLNTHQADRDTTALGGIQIGGRPASQFSFTQLQAEGPSLLGTNPSWMPQQDPNASARSSPDARGRAFGWTDSVRRALSLLTKPENRPETASGNNRSISTSPTKSFHSVAEEMSYNFDYPGARRPTRAVSTSSAALRRKQGAKDWNAKRTSADGPGLLRSRTQHESPSQDFRSSYGGRVSRGSSSPRFTSYGDDDDYEYDDDEDWDVEAAAEGRVVQVTYTVPKEKLRVVNAGAGDVIDEDDEDDKAGGHSKAIEGSQKETEPSQEAGPVPKTDPDISIDSTSVHGGTVPAVKPEAPLVP